MLAKVTLFSLICLFLVNASEAVLDEKYVKRSGPAPASSSCESVRAVPDDIVQLLQLDTSFYTQYTEAYGIPILSSSKCSKQALTRACYVTRFMFAGSQEYRDNIYQAAKFIAIMARDEVMTDIPEQKNWDPSYNERYRGMSMTLEGDHPTTGAEENLVCGCKDQDSKYWLEDYFLHEMAHTLHLVGVNPSDPNFENELVEAQKAAKESGKWGDVYGMQNIPNVHHEYFAEAVQSYFGNNMWFAQPNGWHGPINSREQVKEIDPTIYEIIRRVIPCTDDMAYIDRCYDAMSGWKKGVQQVLKMNEMCVADEAKMSDPVYPEDAACQDVSTKSYCTETLKPLGYCDPKQHRVAPGTMAHCCGCACDCAECQAEGKCDLKDLNGSCGYWASIGECEKNTVWMEMNCGKSCMAKKNPSCN